MARNSTAEIAEFEGLRQEINNRITISFTLIALELAALGVGLSLVTRITQALVGLAAVSSILWLYWIDNSLQLQRLGLYIAISLGPRMSAIEGRPVLGWEIFFRKLHKGGRAADQLLFGTELAPDDKGVGLRAAGSADWYTMVLFGGSAPLLSSLYIGASFKSSTGDDALVWVAAVAVLLVWAYAVSRLVNFKRTIRKYSVAMTSHGLPTQLSEATGLNASKVPQPPNTPAS